MPGIIFFCFIEAILGIKGFHFYPVDLRYNLNQEYRVFILEKGGDSYLINPKKAGIFVNQSFPATKGRNAFRIFILGGSCINYFGDFNTLRERLSSRFPGMNIEIINLGGLSYGSDRVSLVFQEILDYNPDLIILYSGHNEFEEEYLKFIKSSGLLDNLNKSLLSLKTYQAISMLYYNFKKFLFLSVVNKQPAIKYPYFPAQTRVNWGRTFGFKEKEKVYKNYYSNIEWMMNMSEKKGVKVMISTVAYNQIDIAPFYSQAYKGNYDRFKQEFDCKLTKYTKQDSHDPFVEYAKGECLYSKGDLDNARICLERAFVLDAQPHRANAVINNIIKNLARRHRITLIDAEKTVLENSKGGVVSLDLLSDHCHLNSKGKEIILDEFYNKIAEYLSTTKK